MSEHDELAAWVDLEGCFNFRDLGSYRTADGRRMRGGQVFRSDGLQHLTAADLKKLKEEVRLGTVIDLRSPVEVEEIGTGAIAEHAEIIPLPLFRQTREQAEAQRPQFAMPSNMGELYFLMLTFAREPIVEVVRILARAETPTVFHCAAGKDRTGVISALLLSILGVPDQTIVADYAFSRQNIDAINARLNASDSYQRLMSDMPADAYDADPAAMELFLGKVRAEHGGMLEWADAAGIDADTRARLVARLLE
jgi:protein tyrosine/serine phosphatase